MDGNEIRKRSRSGSSNSRNSNYIKETLASHRSVDLSYDFRSGTRSKSKEYFSATYDNCKSVMSRILFLFSRSSLSKASNYLCCRSELIFKGTTTLKLYFIPILFIALLSIFVISLRSNSNMFGGIGIYLNLIEESNLSKYSYHLQNQCQRKALSVVHNDDKYKVNEDQATVHGTSISLRHRQKFPATKDVKREAVAAMNIALDLQNQGKTEKAMKVFQHAIALDPSHSDILTAFGEFLEWHVKDIVKADHMYLIALEHSPEHGRALLNRKRTGPIVDEIDQGRFNRVDAKRALLYTVPNSHPGLRRAKKEAYFSHIYHTNAIEGNTLSLMETRVIVETRLAIGGKSLREQNEVLGLDSALSFINSTLVGRLGRLTLRDILDIHLRVLGYVEPSEAGHFRNTQVYVGDFIPPPPGELKDHMDQLVEWLNSEEAQSLHPIEFAALAHYRLVAIHPFFDGNGRTSRLLMNLILMQAGFPPVSIEVQDRLTYYETLQQANNGDIRPFIRFISECAEKTLDSYLEASMEKYDHSLASRSKERSERIIELNNEFTDTYKPDRKKDVS